MIAAHRSKANRGKLNQSKTDKLSATRSISKANIWHPPVHELAHGHLKDALRWLLFQVPPRLVCLKGLSCSTSTLSELWFSVPLGFAPELPQCVTVTQLLCCRRLFACFFSAQNGCLARLLGRDQPPFQDKNLFRASVSSRRWVSEVLKFTRQAQLTLKAQIDEVGTPRSLVKLLAWCILVSTPS